MDLAGRDIGEDHVSYTQDLLDFLYSRRSQSPSARSGPSYPSGPPPHPVGYSGGPPYPPASGNFSGGYSTPGPVQGRPQNGGGGPRERDYPPRPGRDSVEPGSYARRP